MKINLFLIITLLLFASIVHAQTWNGSVSTNWDLATNWSPATVPGGSSNVVIPTGLTNYPKLASAVTVNSVDFQTGSKLDVNGFALNINSSNAYSYFTEATISNSSTTTDIVFNINTGLNGYVVYFNGNTVSDNIIFNITGGNNFYDGSSAGLLSNNFLFNTTYNLNSGAALYCSSQKASVYNGNLTVNRNTGGITQVFTAGGVVHGNFSYTNLTTGTTQLGAVAAKTAIDGTVGINVNLATNNTFGMYRLINQTTGGSISIKNTTGFDILNDTLKVATFVIDGYKTGAYATFANNSITAATSIGDDVAYTSGYVTYLRSNVFTGTTNFNIKGPNTWYDADQASTANTYNGATTFTVASDATLSLCSGSPSLYNGNLTVNRSVAGPTNLFNTGAVITGNFSHSNTGGGNSSLGSLTAKTAISGTININANYATPGYFSLFRIINQTTGGSISISKTNSFNIERDTLKLNGFSVTNYQSGYGTVSNNNITAATITIADDVTAGGGYTTYIRQNVFTGTTSFVNNGINVFYEADGTGNANTYNGNVSYSATSSGQFNISQTESSTYIGNVSYNRTAAGLSYIFISGANITGNFTCTNNAGGNTAIGNPGFKTAISGTINITANYATPATFALQRVINQTAGGTVTVQNGTAHDIKNDTLAANMSYSNYQTGFFTFQDNSITGNVSISDATTNTGGYVTYIRSNVINGATVFTNNGTNVLYDADTDGPNKYAGNVSYIRNGTGPIIIGSGYVPEFGQSLTLNSSAGINITGVKFTGSTSGTLQQLGTQPIIFPQMTMAKTGTGKLTLASPITISGSLTFAGGNIENNATNPVDFTDDAAYTGAGNTSHITGLVTKTGNDAFIFPIGAATSLNVAGITAPATTSDKFSAQYFISNPATNGYDTAQKAASLKRVSGCEYWDVKRLAGTSNPTLTIGFNGPCTTGGNYIYDPSKLKVAHWNGTQWEDLGNGAYTGTSTGTVTTAGPVTGYSPFTVASTDLVANPLPLHLISFKAFKNDAEVQLQWTTQNEQNASHFDIEKKASSTGFNSFASLASANRAGINVYSKIDNNPASGINYYRLKQVDKDGTFTYSNTIAVDFNTKASLSISPNPVSDFIILPQATTGNIVRIIDAAGRVILMKKITMLNESISVASLTAGVYAVQLISNENVQTVQFVKQ